MKTNKTVKKEDGDIVVEGRSAKLLDIQVAGSGDVTVCIPREKIGKLRQRVVGSGDIHLK